MSIKQLLRNYSYLLLEKLRHILKRNKGDIEFYNDELKRIDQAIAGEK